MEATQASRVCVCNPWTHKELFGLEQGDGTPLAFPVRRRGCQQVLMQWGTPHCGPALLFRKTGGNGACIAFCFPLVYSIGLQVGPQPCNVDLQPELCGLYPLALASNFGCLACLVFLVTW